MCTRPAPKLPSATWRQPRPVMSQSCCPGPTWWYSRPTLVRAAAPAARTLSTGLPACWWPAPPGGPGLQVRAGLLHGSRTYTVRTDGAAWRARTGPGLFAVEGADDTADVTTRERPVSGRAALSMEPGGADEPSGVTVEGVPEAVEELRRCIVTAMQ